METVTFRTPSGVRVPAVTADEMREVDRLAVDEFGIELLQMMENAGRTLAWHVRQEGGDVAVLAGSGGNGGGGLVCARHLHNRDVPVRVVLDRQPEDLDGAATLQHAILDESGVPIAVGPDAVDDASVLVDALVGYGLDGPLKGAAASLVETMNRMNAAVVSLDVPSGLDATTGGAQGATVDPTRLVTLALPKTGLRSVDCPLYLADISLPEALYERLDVEYENPFEERYWVELEP